MQGSRVDGRTLTQLRPLTITAGVNPYAEGSAEVVLGGTRVLASATIDRATPEDIRTGNSGQLLSSLSMLPRSTHVRLTSPIMIEALTHELQSIQGVVVRSLKASLPEGALGDLNLTIDCTVLCSDAGIASAAVAGAWVAMYQALRGAAIQKFVRDDLTLVRVAGVTAGLINGQWLLDVCAEEAAISDFIANIVFDERRHLVDVKATRETDSVPIGTFSQALEAAAIQADSIFKEQQRAVLALT